MEFSPFWTSYFDGRVGYVPKRADSFHPRTIRSFVELIDATGVEHPSELNRSLINRRADEHLVFKYNDIFPDVEVGSLLK